MIFVTVGTHEQPFDRLIREVDRLKKQGVISEDVMIQTGVSSFRPKACRFSPTLPYGEMQEMMKKARIVVTHGGPSSFMAALQYGKIPVVVPRRAEFHEHVNNHQVKFCHEEERKYHNILIVDDIGRLGDVLRSYEELTASMKRGYRSHNAQFNRAFIRLVDGLFPADSGKKSDD